MLLPTNIDPAYLTGLYRGHTSVQADSIARTYIGKWMKLSVSVGDVSSSVLDKHIHMLSGLDNATVGMDFDAATWADRVSVLRRGSQVTVIGTVYRIDAYTLELDNCELVD
ncbi:MAG: hypothetical protein WB992_04695 [Bryobacteraceae bacterium]